MAGRPTKLTKELQEELCDLLSQGHSRVFCTDYVGINYSTFADWMNRGEAGEDLYSDFSTAVKRAEKESYLYHISNIHKAAETTWQASAWYLERRHGLEFGRQEKKTIEMTTKQLTDEERAERTAELLRIAAERKEGTDQS